MTISDRLTFYHGALIQAEFNYEMRNFLVYLQRTKAELLKNVYTIQDISTFFARLNDYLIDDEYKIATNICFSKTIYEKIPPYDAPHYLEVIDQDGNEDTLFKAKNLILNKGWI